MGKENHKTQETDDQEKKSNQKEGDKPTIEIDLAEDKPKKDFLKIRESKKEQNS